MRFNANTINLERSYSRWFGEPMQQNAQPRFAITGYDHCQFFVRGIRHFGKTSAAIVVSRSSFLCKLHFRLSELSRQARRRADGKIVATC